LTIDQIVVSERLRAHTPNGCFFLLQMDDFFTEEVCFDTPKEGEGGAWGCRSPILCERPEPPEVEGTGRMREAGAPRKGKVARVMARVCSPHRGWLCSHHPRSRATLCSLKAKAAPDARGEGGAASTEGTGALHRRGHARPNATVHGTRGWRVCQTAYLAHPHIRGFG
jgi:hypothetical protein